MADKTLSLHGSGSPEFLTAADVRIQCSRMWIERRLRDNDFPRPIQFGGKTSAQRWALSKVVALECSRARVNGSKQ